MRAAKQIALFPNRRPGNTRLVNYGIFQEMADYRIHVCPYVQRAYCFPVEALKSFLQSTRFEERPVYTRGLLTAKGFIVPWQAVPDVQETPIPTPTLAQHSISPDDSTSVKGEKAVLIAKDILERGLFKFSLNAIDVADLDLQISGQDITVNSKFTFQVKCDLKGGSKESGGTGNFFIQTYESNPFRQH